MKYKVFINGTFLSYESFTRRALRHARSKAKTNITM